MSNVCSFTFGGANVLVNHFFAANGNASSRTSITDIGNAFALPVPMRLIGFTFVKSNQNPGEFVLTINGETALHFEIESAPRYTPVQYDPVLPANSTIRLRTTIVSANAFSACLVTLYFIPEHSNPDPLGDRSLIAIPFGGNVATETRSTLLKFSVDGNTGLSGNVNDFTTKFTVPGPMRLYRVGYQKSVSNYDTVFNLSKNGEMVVACRLWRGSGVADFPLPDDSPLRQLEAGDVIQLAYERGIMPGYCLVTLYTTQGRQLGSSQ